MSLTRQFVTRDGTRLNVDVEGDGPPVVFLHGLCGDAGQTREAFPSGCGFRRVTVEARGHGASEPGDLAKLSIATFANDIADLIEQELEAPVIVGGISMGAAIPLRLAIQRPDLVQALIVARPAWVTAFAPQNMAPNAEVGRLLATLDPETAKQAFISGEVGQRLALDAPDNLASLLGFFSRQPIEVTTALLTAIANDGPGVTEDEVASLSIPTLVIGHEKDLIHPMAYARALAEHIAHARLVEITPKVTDRTQYVADFHAAMRNFLKEL
ncbi:alpha/beta fold hydrolase [Rhizobium anhuiense]|uniref:alpha/beta fold hydrolase n=1 Tax=Rhizobium anhuiense TaxID=1184720 RepID=UPI00144232DF|nr:alpha/beta hydrolase [Rhizobium anhuiense]NKM58514.1 alpha/beta fold hydrolase [Rhizobium anhuiense]UTS88200.1 alpha/beta hydrolase [Rhizobium anhuiense bv. trifolii]